MRVSLIATVLNEEASIGQWMASLAAQTRWPDEIVICDGGSQDRTVDIIRERGMAYGLPMTILVRPGSNIAQGRNAAIAQATGEIIACTDAGVWLEPTWLEEILRPFGPSGDQADVVSGFFLPDPHSLFEVVCAAAFMPTVRDIRPSRWIPHSRSIAYKRAAWAAVGGYPEWLDYSEDVVFDLALKSGGYRFVFTARAVVHFRPRQTLRAFVRQMYQYGRGDGKADLWRRRHLQRYALYVIGPLLLTLGFQYPLLWGVLLLWGIVKRYTPYRRLIPMLAPYGWVERIIAIPLLMAVRIIADVATMVGYAQGTIWRLRRH